MGEKENPPSPGSVNPPAPLNVTPSRARNKLAERLAARAKREAEETSSLEGTDPDTADAAAVQQAFEMPMQPLEDLPDLDLSAVTTRQINELIGNTGGTSSSDRVVSAYSSSSSSSSSGLDSGSDDDDEDDATHTQETGDGKNSEVTVGVKRRPSTTEAKKRVPLDDGDDEEQSRPPMQRTISDPFMSPVESSTDSSDEGSDDELSFGSK
ncbi:hypothetical protein KCU71_g16572, partial [Aureobasidium melanogenum]